MAGAELLTTLFSEYRGVIRTLVIFGIVLFIIFAAYFGELGEVKGVGGNG